LSSKVIQLENIVKRYGKGSTEFLALKGVNLTVEQGELLAIMGSSGSGKSTMMNIIGLLDRPTSGKYILSGSDVVHMSEDELSFIRNQKIGFVFQSFFLLPKFSALHNVTLPLMYRGVSKAEATEKAMEIFKRMSIERLAHSLPSQMSGGQQQRVAISRALIGNPDLILADEPTGALDEKTSASVLELLKELHQEDKKTIVIVTHDPEVGKQCPRMVKLHDGEIENE